ncbi:MAG TPA: succinate dehydrogenase [Pyrinomonadaceae bacterium]|jgi:succinate dehydrogenase / fumarate reductase cytochrome b subunit
MTIRLSRTFILRKLHQLSGIVPLGLFLLEHFYTNSKAVNPNTGVADFNQAVADLQGIPYVLLIEIFGIFIPLLYHAFYGLFITFEWRPNNLSYPYGRNWFYSIQRITGIILFFFIAFHVLNFRFGIIPGLDTYGKAVAHHPGEAYSIVGTEFSHTWIFAIYVVGITSTIWHFANGIWLFLVDWGIAIGARAQRLTGYACIAFGLMLLAVGINALTAFITKGGIWGRILY